MNAKKSARLFGLAAFLTIAVLSRVSKADDAWDAARKGYRAFQKHDLDAAIDHYTESIQLNPDYAEAYCSRGMVYVWKRDYDKAIADCTDAIDLKNDYADAYSTRAYAYLLRNEPDKAIEDYAAIIRLQPDDVEAYANMSYAYEKKGDIDKAVETCSEAIAASRNSFVSHSIGSAVSLSKCYFIEAAGHGIEIARLQSKLAKAFYSRACIYSRKGDFDKAIEDSTEFVRLMPNSSETYWCRSTIYYRMGEYGKSIADCAESIRYNSDNPQCYNNLAWIQATCPDPQFRNAKEALANAKKACELDGEKNWTCLGTLAAAYAENGDFEKAREYAQKALELATEEKDKEECRSHLELFKQDKPFHDKAKEK
jgi:tetratricopeptide (TPR) repeat protein